MFRVASSSCSASGPVGEESTWGERVLRLASQQRERMGGKGWERVRESNQLDWRPPGGARIASWRQDAICLFSERVRVRLRALGPRMATHGLDDGPSIRLRLVKFTARAGRRLDSQDARADHLRLVDGEHDRDDVEQRVANHDHGLRVDDAHDHHDGENDGEGEQHLAVVAPRAGEPDEDDDELDDEYDDVLGVAPVALELGQQLQDDHHEAGVRVAVGGRVSGAWRGQCECGARWLDLPNREDDEQRVFDGRVQTHLACLFTLTLAASYWVFGFCLSAWWRASWVLWSRGVGWQLVVISTSIGVRSHGDLDCN